MVKFALKERQDAVDFLRLQAGACFAGQRQIALLDAAKMLERGIHVQPMRKVRK